MHESHLLKNIFKYLEEQESLSRKKIKKIYISLSEFGSLNKEHFLEHYQREVRGTRWEALELELKSIPYGAELEISAIEFA